MTRCFIRLGFVLAVVLGCGTDETTESARFFYFDSLLIGGGGKIFVYEPVNDQLHPPEIWHRRFSGGFHASHIYSAKLTPEGEFEMKTTENVAQTGATLTRLEFFYREEQSIEDLSHDSAVTIRAVITEPTTFLFGPPDSTVAVKYQVEYIEPGPDSIRVILTRLRRFVNSETYKLNGTTYPAMRYVVSETLETETEGFTTTSWQTQEIYAKGIGLVYYRKEINPDFILEYRLKEITEPEPLNSKDQ